MSRYILKRIMLMIPTLFGVMLITFVGDPVRSGRTGGKNDGRDRRAGHGRRGGFRRCRKLFTRETGDLIRIGLSS